MGYGKKSMEQGGDNRKGDSTGLYGKCVQEGEGGENESTRTSGDNTGEIIEVQGDGRKMKRKVI